MRITSATTAEAALLADFVNGAYRGTRASQGWTHEAALLAGQRVDAAMLRETLAAGATILLLRDGDDDGLVACVCAEQDGAASDTWTLGMLAVDPARQDQGLGRRMLQAGEDRARAQSAARVAITVIEGRDSLIAWYERRAYRRTGETVPFPYGDERFGRPLREGLCFVVLEKAL